VNEDVVAAFTLDEAEALLRVEPFHSALCCQRDFLYQLSSPRAGISSRLPGRCDVLIFGSRSVERRDRSHWGEPNPRDTARKTGAAERKAEPVPSRPCRDFATEADAGSVSDRSHASAAQRRASSLPLRDLEITAILVVG